MSPKNSKLIHIHVSQKCYVHVHVSEWEKVRHRMPLYTVYVPSFRKTQDYCTEDTYLEKGVGLRQAFLGHGFVVLRNRGRDSPLATASQCVQTLWIRCGLHVDGKHFLLVNVGFEHVLQIHGGVRQAMQ